MNDWIDRHERLATAIAVLLFIAIGAFWYVVVWNSNPPACLADRSCG